MSYKRTPIIGQSSKVQELKRTADLVARTDVPVLITGETGTGKDLFAHRIHSRSSRSERPFIIVNCSSFNKKYAESILFGHKKNAFVGADDNVVGLVSKARFGTLLLDNIEDLPLSIQAKILQLIELGEIQPPGYLSPQSCDVRVIATSNKDLHKAVESGAFRADLYYRLNAIPLELPALKAREGDIALLIEYFFKEYVHEMRLSAPTISKTAMKQLVKYNWQGNVRELQNFCERMFILFSGREIEVTNLPQEFRCLSKPEGRDDSPFTLPSTGIKLESVEVDLMLQALDKTSGNKSQAARLLGLTRDTFLYRLKKYSINI